MIKSADKLLIGAHTSAAGGVSNALYEGKEIGATTIQLFTANQRRWDAKPISSDEIGRWKDALQETGILKVMSHDSYLINLGAPDPEILRKSHLAFKQELERCHALDIAFLNFHPGSAIDQESERCLDKIADSLLGIEALASKGNTRLLLEATAGQGSVQGYRFEHLAYIISKVEKRVPIGVCIDTCHIFAAGYDIRTPKAWDAVLKEFDKVVGLKKLYAFHLNDSLKGLGSRVDRHANLGDGEIGIDSFRFLMTDQRTREIPKYLETPGGKEVWAQEIPLLRQFAAIPK